MLKKKTAEGVARIGHDLWLYSCQGQRRTRRQKKKPDYTCVNTDDESGSGAGDGQRRGDTGKTNVAEDADFRNARGDGTINVTCSRAGRPKSYVAQPVQQQSAETDRSERARLFRRYTTRKPSCKTPDSRVAVPSFLSRVYTGRSRSNDYARDAIRVETDRKYLLFTRSTVSYDHTRSKSVDDRHFSFAGRHWFAGGAVARPSADVVKRIARDYPPSVGRP